MINLFGEEIHDVGAKPLPLPVGVSSFAQYSDCKKYRYTLVWKWDTTLPRVMFLMMNPSVASEYCADRTLLKCYRYAKTWGYGSLCVVNSAAYRCTDQKRLVEISDPIGPMNYDMILSEAKYCEKCILAYGSPKEPKMKNAGLNATKELAKYFDKFYILELSKDGVPKHPLFLSENLKPKEFKYDI